MVAILIMQTRAGHDHDFPGKDKLTDSEAADQLVEAHDLLNDMSDLERRMDVLEELLARSGDNLSEAGKEVQEIGDEEHSLLQTAKLLKATLDSTTDGIIVLDNSGRAVVFNACFTGLWDISPGLLDGEESDWLRTIALPLLKNPRLFIKKIKEILANPQVVTRDVLRLKDGRFIEASSHPQQIDGVTAGRVWSFRDVTEQRRAQELIEYQATYDALTDLPNRRLLLDRLNQTLARCRRHHRIGALLYLDLDNFKNINDTLGHPVGDALLQEVADRMVRCSRQNDTAARLGGDEFVLLLSEFDGSPEEVASQVGAVADKLHAELSLAYEVQGHRLYSSPSIGITLFPQDGETADNILMQADTAMYRAKEAGRNTVRFYMPSMQGLSEQKLKLQTDLRQALEKDQLEIFWQPQPDATGKVIGAEALLRWRHPEQGLIMPADFIRTAEETGQITALGNFVLEGACRLLKRLADELPDAGPVHLSVNVSPQQFRQADFSLRVARFLDAAGANPSRLTLELTENMLASNLEESMAKMVELKGIGVRFSIDDFGTGYSSLAYLKRLPLDEIKIDRSFVGDIVKDPETVSIVEAIITMATKLGLKVVAEGVESRKEFDFLKKRGCRIFQGNMFCEPMDEGRFWAFLVEQGERVATDRGMQGAFDGF